ncbi:MAG: hypothetical protein WD972_02795 [Candidatus Andersenbacteria bacterium]
MLAEVPLLEHVEYSEAFIEQAVERIAGALKKWRWQLGISPLSIGNTELSAPGSVYHVAILCCKRHGKAPFTLGEWPSTLLWHDQPPCVPAKGEDPYKTWSKLNEVLGNLTVEVRLQEDEETLVRHHLPQDRPYREGKSETELNYALVGHLDVFVPASSLSPKISFPARELALHQILY